MALVPMPGLNDEKELDGTARVEKVTDSTGTAIDELPPVRRLRPRDHRLQRHGGTQRHHQCPWSHKTGSHTYGWGTTESWIDQAGETTTRTKISTGERTVKMKTTYDTTYGMPLLTVEVSGDAAKTGDEWCVRTS